MKHRVLFVALIVVAAVVFAGCGGDAKSSSQSKVAKPDVPKRNTNPSKDWVKVFTQYGEYGQWDNMVVFKRCNGKNLVYITTMPHDDYKNGGIAVIENSDQCPERKKR